MSDPLFCDYRECNVDVHDYARLLQRAARGHVLWEPSSIGAVGDCGQIRDGQFWKFFNVYEDPPHGVPRLALQNPDNDVRTTAVENHAILRSAETVSVSFHGGLPLTAPPASLSLNGAFTWDRSEFAFLALGGRTHVAERLSPLRTQELEWYLVRHEKQIRLALGALSGDLIILHGVTRAPAWMGGVARRTSFEVKTSLSLDIGAINLDWGVSVARNNGGPLSSGVTCAITRGPAGWDGASDVLFTAVVRSVRVKRRQRIISQLLSILGTATASESETLHTKPAVQARPDVRPNGLEAAPLGGTGNEAGPQMDTQADVQMDCGSSFSRESSLSEWELEGDVLDAIMQGALDANPSVDAVVGNWDLIAEFIERYGEERLNPDVAVTLELDAENTAFIVSISPDSNDRARQTHGGSAVRNDGASETFEGHFLHSPPTPPNLSTSNSQSRPELATDNLSSRARPSPSPPAPTGPGVHFGLFALTMDWKGENTEALLLGREANGLVEDPPRLEGNRRPVGDLRHSQALRKPLRACVRCKRLKTKCERTESDSTCRRCSAAENDCIPSSGRPPWVPRSPNGLGAAGGDTGEDGAGRFPANMCEPDREDAHRGSYNFAGCDDEEKASSSTPELDPASSKDPSTLPEPDISLPPPRLIAVVSCLRNNFEDLRPPEGADLGAPDSM